MTPEFILISLRSRGDFRIQKLCKVDRKKQPEIKKYFVILFFNRLLGERLSTILLLCFFGSNLGGVLVRGLVLLLLFTPQGLRVSAPRLGMCA